MVAHRLRFDNAEGEQLCGVLERPTDGPVRGTALFAHCFTCHKDYKAPVWIGRELAARGVCTMRFDFPGLGSSEGRFADTTLRKNVSDVVFAARALGVEEAAPSLLIGHSLGGAAVLRAAAAIPSVRLVVTIGTPAEPARSSATLARAHAEAKRDGEAVLPIGGRSLRIRRAFFDDLESDVLLDHVRGLGVPLLVLHAPEDSVVGLEQGERLFAAAPQPKGFVALAGADHLLGRREDCRFVAALVAAFFERHLEVGSADAAGRGGAGEPI